MNIDHNFYNTIKEKCCRQWVFILENILKFFTSQVCSYYTYCEVIRLIGVIGVVRIIRINRVVRALMVVGDIKVIG